MGDWPDPMAPSDWGELAREVAEASGSLEELRAKKAARDAALPVLPVAVPVHIAHVAMDGRGYAARCNCRWSGPTRLRMSTAYADLDQHEVDHPIEVPR